MNEVHPKVSPGHLSRDAYLYVRQSTVRQVCENTESTRRTPCARGASLGWPAGRVVAIDTDLDESGADRDRDGFQRLVAEVGMGHAGIVLGLDVSRLARNSIDWHRLLEICALSDTLILDEDGIYDPADFKAHVLLGLKGTMSEAELHMLHARLRGGLMNQARRGTLKLTLCRSDSSTIRSTRSCSIPMPRYNAPSACSSTPLPAPVRRRRRCDTSVARGSTSPATPPQRSGEGPAALAAGHALVCPWYAAQSALCGSLRLRARPQAAQAGRQRRVRAHAHPGVDGPAARRVARLHRLGSHRGPSAATA